MVACPVHEDPRPVRLGGRIRRKTIVTVCQRIVITAGQALKEILIPEAVLGHSVYAVLREAFLEFGLIY